MTNFYVHQTAVIHPSVKLGFGVWVGEGVRIEKDVVIAPYCVIGSEPEHKAFFNEKTDYSVTIESGVRISSFVTIDRGTRNQTLIGQNTVILNHSHIAHDCVIGRSVIIGGSVSLAGHTLVMDGANVNGKTCTVPFAVIGAYSFCGAMSFITNHVQPGMKAIGYPARQTETNVIGLQRAGIDLARCTDLYLEEFHNLTKERHL